MGSAAVLPVHEGDISSMWSQQERLEQLSIGSNIISLLKVDTVLTTGLALDVASRSWSVTGGRPPGVAAHSGASLPEKQAFLRRGLRTWRGIAVDEGDDMIALCISACVKD